MVNAAGNFSPHLTTAKDTRAGAWAAANNTEIACTQRAGGEAYPASAQAARLADQSVLFARELFGQSLRIPASADL